MTAFLHSPRLAFRTWTHADLPLAVALWGDPDVTRYIGGPQSPAQAAQRLQLEIDHQHDLGYSYWPIFARAGDELHTAGEHAGCAGLKPYGDGSDPAVLEIGVHIARPFWSGRYGEEAARAVIAHAFATLPVRALVARHHPENANSRALMQRLGLLYSHDEHWAPNRVDCPVYFLHRPADR